MQLVSPDILADARGISVGLTMVGLGLGVALWLFGWWSHRFWVALLTTALAGIYGLSEGRTLGAQPLLAGVLLAIAGGMLSLAILRLLTFAAGGALGVWAMQSLAPQINQPLLAFLVCGLLGILLFRVGMMALSSLAGGLLASYCGLCLLDHAGTLDCVSWTRQGAVLLNWLCGLLVIVGMTFQYLLERRLRRAKDDDEDDNDEPALIETLPWVERKSYRRAG